MKRTDLLSVLRGAADILFPRHCLCCHERLATDERFLCAGCLLRLPRIRPDSFEDNAVTRMFWGLIPVCKGAALFRYTKASVYSHLLFALKYYNRPEVGTFLGQILADELRAAGFFDGIDLLIPIPLARKKERQRGYNQSLWIARGVAKATSIPIDTKSVVRTVHTSSQTTLDDQRRRTNVQGIFAVRNPQQLQGRHILLIDDVITTGSTMLSCAETIAAAAGQVRISLLCLALAGHS